MPSPSLWCIYRINSFILSSALKMFGFFLVSFLGLAGLGSVLTPVFDSSLSLANRFSSFNLSRSSRFLASSSISYGVLVLYCLKKKLTMVERIAESHKIQAVRLLAPPGKGELSLYYA